MNLYDQLEELIATTSRITHDASAAINSDMSDADCEELATSLEMLAKGLRRIPTIRRMLNEN